MIQQILEELIKCESETKQDMGLELLFSTYQTLHRRLHLIVEMMENQNISDGPLHDLIESLASQTDSEYLLVSDAFYTAGLDRKNTMAAKPDANIKQSNYIKGGNIHG